MIMVKMMMMKNGGHRKDEMNKRILKEKRRLNGNSI